MKYIYLILFLLLFISCENDQNKQEEQNKEKADTTYYTEEIKVKEGNFFLAVEEMPAPIGGIAAIQKKVKYPELAKRAGIEGRVFVAAYVDESGKVSKTEIIKGIGGGCDSVAAAAVRETDFLPARQNGKRVKVKVVVPVIFKLK